MSDFAAPDGAWPILLTAFDENRQLDLPAISAMLRFYDGLGSPGVLALGQASEMLLLNDEERMRVAAVVAQQPRDNLSIATVGNFGETLQQQASSLQRVYDMGADIVVVALALLPSAKDLAGQLLKLASLVSPEVRLGIYEIPEPEHRLLSPAEVRAVAQSGRYYFMKDTCRLVDIFGEKVAAAADAPLKLYQANLATLPGSMDAGGAGFCGWMPIVAPELCAQVCDLSLPAALRKRAHQKLTDFNELMVAHGFPASAKHILSLRGVPIRPFSRRATGDRFFERPPAELEAWIARENPFTGVAP